MPRIKKQSLVGNGMNANLLKQFIDYSYLGNTSIAPTGYSIDAPLSDSRVKVYTKNGSNDKDVVVTHRGSVGIDDWLDNASYLFKGKVKGTKTYNLHRERHKKAVDKYGAKNIIAVGHSRAGLYIQELNKEFPMKEIISYNKASGFFDIGKTNAENQTDVRVGNDIVSLLAPLQKNPNKIVKIDGTKNPLDFNKAHQTSELDKLGTTFIGKKDDPTESTFQSFQMTEPDFSIDKSTIGKGMKKVGEGIQPRISGVNQIRKLLGVEQRRLKRIQDGTHKYKTKYITETKTLEKISRLKERLKSAEANQGQATEEFFVPKTDKWLKINKTETYLNTPLKEDGRHQLMLTEIDKRIALSKAKKAEAKAEAKEKRKAEKAEKIAAEKAAAEKAAAEKAAAEKAEAEKPKPKLTKEERKAAKLAKKKEYDRLRYLKIKAKKEYDKDVSIEVVECKYRRTHFYLTLNNAVYIYHKEDNPDNTKYKHSWDLYEIMGHLTSWGEFAVTKRKNLWFQYFTFFSNRKSQYFLKGKQRDLRRNDYEDSSRPTLSFIMKDIKNTRQLEPYTDITRNEVKTIQVPRAKYEEIMKKFDEKQHIQPAKLTDKETSEMVRLEKISGKDLTDEEIEEMRKRLSGSGFNKKQLTQIILDKNKVIADLEETAYGGNCNCCDCDTNYLDIILDSNSTPQNMIIHKEHINSVPKHIQPL